jgi:hypothetical protein
VRGLNHIFVCSLLLIVSFSMGGSIVFTYGFVPTSTDSFYTRQVEIPLSITVQSALEIQNMHILPFNNTVLGHHGLPVVADSPIQNQLTPTALDRSISIQDLMVDVVSEGGMVGGNPAVPDSYMEMAAKCNHCLVTFDIKNMWVAPFDVKFSVHDGELFIFF